jgi:predicted Zn-dependent protease
VTRVALALLVACGGSDSYRVHRLPSACSAATDRSDAERCATELYDELMTGSLGVYDDAALEAYVTDVGLRIAAHAGRDDLSFTFRVLDEPGVQAWAGPGGYVYVTRGLLAHLDSEAELAAVLGHEVAHVAADHTDTILDRLPEPYLGVDLTDAFVLARDDEAQADQLAVRYAAAAGYDPRAVTSMLIAIHQPGLVEGEASWSERHPPLEVRLALTARATDGRTGGRTERERYLRAIEGLVVGIDPRQGRVEGRRFVHERGGFSFELPEGLEAGSVRTNGWFGAGDDREGLAFFPLAHPRGGLFELALETDMARSPSRAIDVLGFEGLEGTLDTDASEEVNLDNVSGRVPVTTFSARDGYSYGLVVFSQGDDRRSQAIMHSVLRSFRREPARSSPRRVRVRTIERRTPLERIGGCGDATLVGRLNELAPESVVERGARIKCVGS